jgi:hypothetical protein
MAQIVAINSNAASPLTITASVLRLSNDVNLSNSLYGESNNVMASGNFGITGNINANQYVRVGFTGLGGGIRSTFAYSGTPIADNDFMVFGHTGRNVFYSSDGYHDFGKLSGVSWSSSMRLTAAGRLLLGTTSESVYILDVVGATRFSTDITIANNIVAGYGGGAFNNVFGTQVFQFRTTGDWCTAIGYQALRYNGAGNFNSAFGSSALVNSGGGSHNTGVGFYVLGNLTSGSNNVAIGSIAGEKISGGTTNLTAADNSIFIGYSAKALADGQTNQIVIGHNTTGLGSNTTVIGNSSTVTSAIYGRLLLGTTTDSGLYQLDVNGTARVSGHSDGLSFSATGSANTRTTSIGTFVDFQTTHGRLFAYNFNTNAWLPILLGSSRLILSTSLGSRTESFVASTAYFSGDVRMVSQQTLFGATESNGIFSPSTYSNANYPVIENNSIGIIAGVNGIVNPAWIAATKISFQIGQGTDTKIAQFSPTTGNLILQGGGTFTDAGYRLDVNGTARVSGQVTVSVSSANPLVLNRGVTSTAAIYLDGAANIVAYGSGTDAGGAGTEFLYLNRAANSISLFANTTQQFRIFSTGNTHIQNGGTFTDIASALLAVNSTTKGFLPPRMTNAQRTAISSPAVGLIVYQTDSTEGTYEYTSAGWRIINAAGGGSGTVTTVSVASANGFAGTVANATTTPAITISTTVTGLLKGNGTAISAATAGTDYLTPSDVAYSVANVSTTYSETATKGTKIIKADTTGGAFTINLPTAVSNTAIIIIKKVAGSGALTIDGNSTETIDGGTTATINKVYESITLISDNTNWQIV